MNAMYLQNRRSAFTLTEALIVAAVLAILAVASWANYDRSKARARDANRRSGASSYQGAMDLYKQAKGTFLVSNKAGNYLGYQQEGWGRITAKSTNGSVTAGYGTTSIAEALFDQGFLTEVKTAPALKSLSEDLGKPGPIGLANFRDYLLAVCDRSGAKAYNGGPAGEEFAIYSFLESPSNQEPVTVKARCGGPESTNYWLQVPMQTGEL